MSAPDPTQHPLPMPVPAVADYQGPGADAPPAPPFPPRWRRPAASEIVSWCIVLLLVAITAITVAREQSADKDTSAQESQLTLSAKYAVGVHGLLPGSANQLLTELDPVAKTPDDRFRMALVAGEVQGKDEALRRIAAATAADPALLPDANIARALYSDELPAAADLAAFNAKWGWFADLAESYGKPPGDPTRKKTLDDAYWVVLAMGGGLLAGGIMGVVGLGLFITAIGLLVTRRVVPALAAVSHGVIPKGMARLWLPTDRRAYIQAFAWFIGLYFGTEMLLRNFAHIPDSVNALITLAVMPTSFLLALFWPRLMGGTWSQWRAAFGLHLGRGFFREVLAGLGGYIAGMPVLILGLLATLVLVKLSGANPTHPINGAVEHGNWLIILLVFGLASVWAPITEELTFRGALYIHLRERFGWLPSAVTVGLLFALVHPQGWTVVPFLASMGFVLATIREWRGSIIGCMTAHCIHNTLTLAILLLLTR